MCVRGLLYISTLSSIVYRFVKVIFYNFTDYSSGQESCPPYWLRNASRQTETNAFFSVSLIKRFFHFNKIAIPDVIWGQSNQSFCSPILLTFGSYFIELYWTVVKQGCVFIFSAFVVKHLMRAKDSWEFSLLSCVLNLWSPKTLCSFLLVDLICYIYHWYIIIHYYILLV